MEFRSYENSNPRQRSSEERGKKTIPFTARTAGANAIQKLKREFQTLIERLPLLYAGYSH